MTRRGFSRAEPPARGQAPESATFAARPMKPQSLGERVVGGKLRVPASACSFVIEQDQQAWQFATDDKGAELTRFSMVVNSGRPILGHGWWGNLGIDLAGVRFRQRMPALENHDTNRRLGFTESVRHDQARGIVAEGRMLSNPAARQITADSRDGFPFQASCYLKPARVQLVDEGEEVEVNGFVMKGPGAVFRESTMREVTFCPLGADPETSAAMLADDGDAFDAAIVRPSENPHMTKKLTQEPEQAPAAALAVPVPNPASVDAQAERQRSRAILGSAVPEQHALALALIESDKDLPTCLLELNQDLRARLAAKPATVPATPTSDEQRAREAQLADALQSRGNGNTNRLALVTDEGRQLAEIEAMPDGADKWKRQFAVLKPDQRAEFSSEAVFAAWMANRDRVRVQSVGADSGAVKLSGAVSSLGYRNVVGSYFMRLEEVGMASWVSSIASMMTSDQPMELYKFLGAAPTPRKWTGERSRQQLTDFGMKVFNDKFEDTIEADIDDLRRDKTGQIRARISDLAGKVATLPQRVLTDILINNATGYDGVALYSDSHSVGQSGTTDNLLGATVVSADAPTATEMTNAILASIQAILGFKDDSGDPANAEAKSFAVMVPTKYWASLVAAIRNDFLANGVTNTLKTSGIEITPIVNPRLTGTAAAAGRRIYTFRTDAAVRALIWQDEAIADAMKVLGPESDNGFWRESVAFGAKRIGNGAVGRFELTARTEFST
jgi:phage major head subunit gpT-like protein